MTEETTHEPVDRTGWAPGPWDTEPDRFEWYDETTDYPCLAKRNSMGAWCGYVAVPPGHPFHKVGYADASVAVHGDLTYAGLCNDDIGICHVPRPGEPDDVWWLGFDCAHSHDYCPIMARYDTHPWDPSEEAYRTLDYVKQQCANLAAQLANADT